MPDFQIDAWNSRSRAKQMKSVSSSLHSGRACEKAHLRNSVLKWGMGIRTGRWWGRLHATLCRMWDGLV